MGEDIIKKALHRFKDVLDETEAGSSPFCNRRLEADRQLVHMAIKKYNTTMLWRKQRNGRPLKPPVSPVC
mgnify:CR=1 FL=1